jgi:hypothetical protein
MTPARDVRENRLPGRDASLPLVGLPAFEVEAIHQKQIAGPGKSRAAVQQQQKMPS